MTDHQQNSCNEMKQVQVIDAVLGAGEWGRVGFYCVSIHKGSKSYVPLLS